LRYERIMGLKNLARTGWMLRGVPHELAETVAEHTFEVAFLTLLITEKLASQGISIDQGKALKIALIHDLPESVSGDIVKWSKRHINSHLTNELDREALRELGLGDYSDLIDELNDCKSLEACIVKLADNLSTSLQAARYMRTGYSDVKEIFEGTEAYVKTLMSSEPLNRYYGIIESLIKELLKPQQ